MNLFSILLTTLLLTCASAVILASDQTAATPASPNKPNIVVILADDLGYGDVRCNNPERGKIATPHIDRLAARGMRFTDGHSSSGVCSPSRYALLTGRYHWRTRLQAGIVGYLDGPLIVKDRLTVAGLAKQHGYATACVGKWHLGWEWNLPQDQRPLFAPPRGAANGKKAAATSEVTAAHRAAWNEVYARPIGGGPTTRGFDEYFGTDVPNWPPYCFIDGDRTVGIPSEFLPASKLVKNQASLPGPALADWNLEGILPALTDRACDFIQRRSATREPFLLYLPLTTPHTPLAVNEAWRGKSGLDNDCADLIMETDAAVGRVLDALDKSGTADNTLVLFTADNGFASYTGVKELEARGHFSSGPLRGYKGDAWEGGHRVPFLIRWPAVVEPGRVCCQLVHHADLIATVADILGHKLPDNAGEDSFSLLPLLKGSDQPIREHAVSCGSQGLPAVRKGPWKYLPGSDGGGGWSGLSAEPKITSRVQLYNLADDLGEKQNLADEQPDRVAELQSLLDSLVDNGRSRPGPVQKNDVAVKRFPVAAASK